MATKDVTKEKQAKTVEDVNKQDARTRLWQSLNTTYSNQMDESDKAYDKSISQQNNAMLARGLGRSSFAAQIAANMYNDKNTARNKLGEALIADYQNRISDIERQEKEDEWRNKEWDYKLSRDAVADERYADELKYSRDRDTIADKRYEDELAYSRSRDTVADKRYEDELAYSRNRDTIADKRYEDELAYSRGRDTIADKRYEDELAYSRGRDTIADKRYEDELAYSRGRDDVADKRYADELAYARGRDAIADARYADETAYSREQDALNRAFAEQQWEDQKAQWREEYDFNKMTSDQKIAFEVITAALAAGNDVDDATLKRAGISRAEFNTMKQKAAATGSGGTAYWKSLGFASEKDYSAARKLGMNADQYKAYIAGQNGNGGNTVQNYENLLNGGGNVSASANVYYTDKNGNKVYITNTNVK